MQTNKHLATGIAAVGATAALASFLFIIPNYREARDVRTQVADLQSRVGLLSTRTEAVDRLAEELRVATAHAASELKSIPETADIAGLIRKLSDHIDGVNVAEQTFTAGTPAEAIVGGESTAMVMPLTAEMKATFESVIALIDKAESMSRLVRVCSVRLVCKRDEQKADVPLIQAGIGLEAIYDPQEPTHEGQ